MIVSVFKDIFQTESPVYRDVMVVLNLIKTGKYKEKVHQIRMQATKKERDAKKRYLPSICFSGKFPIREDDKCTEHSGLAIIDYDHVQDVEEFRKKINSDNYTFASFVSPSGDGIKVLIKIPPEPENHKAYYYGIMHKYANMSIDSTSQNLSRVCYISYDPYLYINENSDVWDTKGKIEKVEKIIQKSPVYAVRTDYAKMNILAKMVADAADGEKHQVLIKASRLAGGFIAGGLIEEHVAVQTLEYEINKRNISDFKGAQKTIQDGIEYGKREPIYEQNYDAVYKRVMEEVIIVEGKPAKDVIFLDDVRDKIIYTYENGVSEGETTHFHEFDNHFRLKRGEVTLFHGIGNHGKSQFAMQLALLKSVFCGYKWGIFSPENMPVEEFYKDLIHVFIGKSTEKHHSNRMNFEELKQGMDFISKHFFLIYPENDSPTPEYINYRFRELIIKNGIDGCIIDPYNQLDIDLQKANYRDDQYLSKFLTAAKRFAVENDVFYWIVSHPKGTLTKSDKTKDYEMPNVYDLHGGSMWNNKCDNIVCVHRPRYSSDKSDTTVLIASQKIKKQKLCGRPGTVTMFFDIMSQRYFTNFYRNPLDTTAGSIAVEVVSSKLSDVVPKEIKPNIEFDFTPPSEEPNF